MKAELMVCTHFVFHKKHSVQNDNVYNLLFISVSWYVLCKKKNRFFLKYHQLCKQLQLFPTALLRQTAEVTVSSFCDIFHSCWNHIFEFWYHGLVGIVTFRQNLIIIMMTNPMLVIHCKNKWYFQTSAVSSAFTYKNIAKSYNMLLKVIFTPKELCGSYCSWINFTYMEKYIT